MYYCQLSCLLSDLSFATCKQLDIFERSPVSGIARVTPKKTSQAAFHVYGVGFWAAKSTQLRFGCSVPGCQHLLFDICNPWKPWASQLRSSKCNHGRCCHSAAGQWLESHGRGLGPLGGCRDGADSSWSACKAQKPGCAPLSYVWLLKSSQEIFPEVHTVFICFADCLR